MTTGRSRHGEKTLVLLLLFVLLFISNWKQWSNQGQANKLKAKGGHRPRGQGQGI